MAIEAKYQVNYPDLYSDYYAPKPSASQSLYPDLNMAPSAPPLEVETPAAPSAPPVEEKPIYGDCSICLETCTDAPEGNSALSETISKTACKHFFHDYCLQKWMAEKDSCPNCRSSLAGKEITHIVWDEAMTPRTTVAKPPENVPSFKDTASNMLAGAGKATLKASLFAASVLGLVAWEGAKLTGGVLKQALLPQMTPEFLALRTKHRKQVLGHVHQEIVKKHEALMKNIQKQDMDMRLMLGKVVSVCDATHPRQHTIMDAIDKVQKRLASQTESFQRDMCSILADVKEIELLLNVTKSV